MPVVVMDDVLHRLVAPLVGLAVGAAPLESPAGHPLREAVGVVVASPLLRAAVVLEHRQPPHLAPPVDDRRVEEAALLEIGDEGRRRLIDGETTGGKSAFDAAVMVPRLPRVEHLNVADAALDEPAGDEAARGVIGRGRIVDAVEGADVRGL